MNIRWKPIHSIILLLIILYTVTLGFNVIMLGDHFDSTIHMTSLIVMEWVIMLILAALLSIPIILGFKRESKAMIIFFSAVFLIIMFFGTLVGISALENKELEMRMEERKTQPIETHNHAIDDVLSEIS